MTYRFLTPQNAKRHRGVHDSVLELVSSANRPLTLMFSALAVLVPPKVVSVVVDQADLISTSEPELAGALVGGLALAGLAGFAQELSSALRDEAELRVRRPVAAFLGSAALVSAVGLTSFFTTLSVHERPDAHSTWWEAPTQPPKPADLMQLFINKLRDKRTLGAGSSVG